MGGLEAEAGLLGGGLLVVVTEMVPADNSEDDKDRGVKEQRQGVSVLEGGFAQH